MSLLNVHRYWLTCLISAAVFMAYGVVPNGYMLDRTADTGEIILRICTGGSSQERYVVWDPSTGEQTPMENAEGNSGHEDHDTGDAEGMPCTIASQVLMANVQDVQTYLVRMTHLAFMAPLTRAPPLYRTASAPLPARGPPTFLN